MHTTTIHQLGHRLQQVPDVRFAQAGPDPGLVFQQHHADLVVETWMGARFYTYILDHPPKPRDLRTILRENTRGGIGTLFLVDKALLPTDNTLLTDLIDWQEILLGLNDGWIYAYEHDATAHDLKLTQVHYTLKSSGREYAVWHLCDFDVENAAVRQRDLNNQFKGRFAVADIASPAYKRRINHERVHQRFHYRTRQKQEQQQTVYRVPADLQPHYDCLQVKQGADKQAVKQAYRRLALQLHPDVSALPREVSEQRFKQLNEAYETIKRHHGWT